MGVTFDPKNILIVLHGSIGDVTRALPLANLIRRGFPKATLSWTVETSSFPLVEHYLKFAEYLGLNPRPIEWNFKLTEQEESSVGRHLGNVNRSYAVLFVGSRWESKQWFPSQAAECARLIQERHKLDVVLLGGKDDGGLAGEII